MVLGNLALELNLDIEEVIKSGHGLAFITYPTAIGKFAYPGGRPYLAFLFFFMLGVLGLGSLMGLINCLNSVLYDGKLIRYRLTVLFIVCFSGYCIGTIYLTPVSIYKIYIVHKVLTYIPYTHHYNPLLI